MGKLTTAKFRFRKHARIGAADAEQDDRFLPECFVDSGDLTILRDCADPRRILLGRTGSGKTALLKKLQQEEDHVVFISPENLSLTYLTNSSLLRSLAELGVDLDLFYRLLWQHVFSVELIKERYRIRNEADKASFVSRMIERLSGDKRKERAMKYLVDWGESFWEETEYRVKEITKKFEKDIHASLGTSVKKLYDASAAYKRRLSEEERIEIRDRAQAVVNKVQIRELFEVIDVLASDVFDDPQYRVYLAIDRLDEDWIDDRLRYKLIRALIEAVRLFAKVKSAKIILALRRDLLDRVIRETRDTGFQEEKYTSLYLPLAWTEPQIISILDRRVDSLVREQYTTCTVTHQDLLPSEVDKEPIERYMLDRTFHRPRDIILLFNSCIQQAVDRPIITQSQVRAAEEEYSRERLRSLADEWYSVFPDLLAFVDLLKKRPRSFRVTDVTEPEIEELCLQAVTQNGVALGEIAAMARHVVDELVSASDFRAYVLRVFYRVGLVGLRTEGYAKTAWSFKGPASLPAAAVKDDSCVFICPMFWRILGVPPK